MSKIDIIKELLKDKTELICANAFDKSIKYIKELLSMSEWDDPKFQKILTIKYLSRNIIC